MVPSPAGTVDYRIVESEFREHCIRDVGVGYYVDACGCEFVDESFYSLGYFILCKPFTAFGRRWV